LIQLAYQVEEDQLSGPAWLVHPRPFEVPLVDIQAKLPAGATRGQVPEMLQALLAERFKLRIHRETQQRPIYALVVSEKGAQFRESVADGPPFGPPAGANLVSDYEIENDGRLQTVKSGSDAVEYFSGPDLAVKITGEVVPGAIEHIEASKVTLAWLAQRLFYIGDRRVVDMTGLRATYRMTLDLPREGSGADVTPFLSKLGLKLEKRTAPIEVLMVDHMEKTPTAN